MERTILAALMAVMLVATPVRADDDDNGGGQPPNLDLEQISANVLRDAKIFAGWSDFAFFTLRARTQQQDPNFDQRYVNPTIEIWAIACESVEVTIADLVNNWRVDQGFDRIPFSCNSSVDVPIIELRQLLFSNKPISNFCAERGYFPEPFVETGTPAENYTNFIEDVITTLVLMDRRLQFYLRVLEQNLAQGEDLAGRISVGSDFLRWHVTLLRAGDPLQGLTSRNVATDTVNNFPSGPEIGRVVPDYYGYNADVPLVVRGGPYALNQDAVCPGQNQPDQIDFGLDSVRDNPDLIRPN